MSPNAIGAPPPWVRSILRQAVARDPQLGRAWLDLGGAEAEQGHWDQAAEAWRRFLAIGQPAGFVTGIKERELPRAERLEHLLA